MTRFRDSSQGWGLVTRLLHWSLAAGILAMLVLGLWMVRLDYYHPLYLLLPEIHRTLGLLLFPLLFFRILWRASNPRPVADLEPVERFLSRLVQVLLLWVPILMVVSGYLTTTADGRPLLLLGWLEIPAPGLEIANLEDRAGAVHAALAWLLMGALGLHLLGALKHHFVDRDVLLRDMLFGGGRP